MNDLHLALKWRGKWEQVRVQNCSTRGAECVRCSGTGPRASRLAFAPLQGDDGPRAAQPTFALSEDSVAPPPGAKQQDGRRGNVG